jgi:hypothetical protein
MMYVRYPELGAADRPAHMRVLDGLNFTIPPSLAAAATAAKAFQDVRASSLLDRPVYRFQSGAKYEAVFADTGELFRGFNQAQAQRVAAASTIHIGCSLRSEAVERGSMDSHISISFTASAVEICCRTSLRCSVSHACKANAH